MKYLVLSILLLFAFFPAEAAIWVTDLTDDLDTANGTCNLREAIMASETNAAVDACPVGDSEIFFAVSGRIDLISGLAVITNNLSIHGPGADLLTIDGNGFDRVFLIEGGSPGRFRLSGMTITGGENNATNEFGGGIHFTTTNPNQELILSGLVVTGNQANGGGGIYQDGGILIIENSSIVDNEAPNGSGGGLRSASGSLLIQNSSIIDNECFSRGGGLTIASDAEIIRSTISGNIARLDGGGIYAPSGSLDVSHTTITNNTTGTLTSRGDGGGMDVGSSNAFTMKNSIVEGNEDLDVTQSSYAPDINTDSALNLTSFGHNLIGIYDGGAIPTGDPNIDGDYVGTSLVPILAQLDALADNGGPTMTHLPSFDLASNVIDHGSCLGENYDQRGYGLSNVGPRVIDLTIADEDDGCDIGAVERGSPSNPAVERAIDLDLMAILSGAYTNILMSTDLNTGGHLPATQPYSGSPWNYPGTETNASPTADMVDWVLVELVKGAPSDPSMSVEHTRAAVLHDNGEILDIDESSLLLFEAVEPGNYFVVIRHRNHVPIMSAEPIQLEWESTESYDFSSSGFQAFSNGGASQQDLGSGLFGLWGGEGDANGNVSAFDFLNVWLPANGGPAGYTLADFDMNGSATAFDFLNVWLSANGQSSQLPF